jgi:CRP/FNR family transcriptional regulator, cyclic AMP receptor protein
VITSGTVEVHKAVLPGRRQNLVIVEAPTVVGEMGLLPEPRAAASVEARTPVEAHSLDRNRLLEMLDDDSPAACKVDYEIGRTLSARMARTDASITDIIGRLEGTEETTDFEIFQDRLIRDWSF